MELILNRKYRTPQSTIGVLSRVNLNGHNEELCFILEDTDRGLHSGMTEAEISKIKVHSKTAIPAGRYKIALTFSNRFQKYLPELIAVKGFAGIRIHSGNTAADSEGCLLTGQKFGVNEVTNSRPAFNYLYSLLQAAEKKEKLFITIQ
jgi:hypothetical protein